MNGDKSDYSYSPIMIYSIVFSVVLTAVALIVGFLSASQVILFDGIFMFIGAVLTYFSVLSVRFINREDLKNYPFGKAAFEPFIVIVQYTVILMISATNMVLAVMAILENGTVTDIGFGVLYGVISMVLCFAAYMYLKHLKRRRVSAIEEVELQQWKYSLLFSIGVTVGFAAAWVLLHTPLAYYARFADPILAIIITLVFIKTAVKSIYNCVKELLMASPSPELRAQITELVNCVSVEYPFSNMVLRLGKAGGQLIVEIDYVIEAGSELDCVRTQDALRRELADELEDLLYEPWFNVTFTGDIKWTE